MTTTRAYVRESTVEQGTKFGPDAQRAAILRACVELALPAPDRWYTDLVSGTGKVVRDELQRAIAEARDYDVLVLYDTSRFARKEIDAFTFERDLARLGVRIYYAAEGIWADDDTKALQKGVMHVINAQYSRDLGRRITDGYRAKFERLGLPGGALPWGYRWADETARVVVLSADAPLRRELLTLYASGSYSAKSLADELNRRGHRLHGKPFVAWTVYEVLKNPIAVGVARRKGEERPDVAPALVDRKTWETVQRILAERRGRQGAARRHVFVFSSRARHDACGRALWGDRKVRPTSVTRRLIHSAPTCGVPFRRSEAEVEALFIEWLATWSFDDRQKTKLVAFLRGRPTDDDKKASLRHRAEARLERARRLYLLGDLDDAAYDVEKREARAVLDATAPASTVGLRDATKLIALASAFDRATVEGRRAFVEGLTSEVRMGERVELVIRPHLRPLVAAIAAPEVGGGSRGLGWSRVNATHPLLTVDPATRAEHRRWEAFVA